MYNEVSNPEIVNATFAENRGEDGGGIYNQANSYPTFTNMVIWGNESTSPTSAQSPSIYVSSNSSITVSNSIVEHWSKTELNATGGNGNFNSLDPLFVTTPDPGGDNDWFGLADNNYGNLALQQCSPAIDAGNNSANTTMEDLSGNSRVINATGSVIIDLGAYEYQATYNFCQECLTSGNILYVDANASGNNDGKSWTDAFNYLQDALTLASACSNVTEVWVADGTYYPDEGIGITDNNTETPFKLEADVAIYGGFAGGENNLALRDWVNNKTTLSGDLKQDDLPNFVNTTDNAIHVVRAVGSTTTNTSILDGFTITAGRAFGNNSNKNKGGGLFCSSNAKPIIRNCEFVQNEANHQGGGLAIQDAGTWPIIENCRIAGNKSQFDGGGIFNFKSSLTVINSVLSGNVSGHGGGLYNFSTTANQNNPINIINCAFSGNIGSFNSTIFNAGNSNFNLINSIVWGNNSGFTTTVNEPINASNCIIQGGYPGTDVLDVDPLFVSQPNFNNAPTIAGDLSLQACSPAIDAGDNSANTTTEDLSGNSRILSATGSVIIDLGAYEYQATYDICKECLTSGNILYVDANASGNNDGKTWTDAFNYLQDALTLASACSNVTEVWVADGTYYPDEGGGQTNNDRDAAFELIPNVAIYGGFVGGENSLSERNWETNVAVLSGDLMKNDGAGFNNNEDNAYHVVLATGAAITPTSLIDGFQISRGNSSSSIPNDDVGGGMLVLNSANPSLYNCLFTLNSSSFGGGGLGFQNANNSCTISGCTFEGNRSSIGGGAMIWGNSNFQLTGCRFIGNTANSIGGGLACSSGADPTINNCIFKGNKASFGGGIYNGGNDMFNTIINSTFSGNLANSGGALGNTLSQNTVLNNCILWGNSSEIQNLQGGISSVSYSIVQGGYTGTGNLDIDPLFVSQPDFNNAPTTNGDLSLLACSPAIDAGDNNANTTTEDLAGNSRVVNALGTATIDMGAFEYQSVVDYCTCLPGGGQLYVDANASGLNNGTSWDDAFVYLQDALTLAQSCSNITEIWVADGTYYPDEGVGISNNNTGATFKLRADVAIYGGFAGGENNLALRDWVNNKTTLSGDLKQNDLPNFGNNSDNAIHVVSAIGATTTNTSILDGFTITAGRADGNSLNKRKGGGLFCSSTAKPIIRNCEFVLNEARFHGGGLAVQDAGTWPIIENCRIAGNLSQNNGGGIYIDRSSLTIINSAVSGNVSGHGGGLYNYSTLTNPINPINIINCTFTGNNETDTGTIFNRATLNFNLINSIVWGNSSALFTEQGGTIITSNCIIQGGYPGTSVLDVDPLFVDHPDFNLAPTLDGILQVQQCSPAIDGGEDAANLLTTDLDGNIRKYDAISGGQLIDIGAFEFQSNYTLPSAACLNTTVQLNASGSVSIPVTSLNEGSSGCPPISLTVEGETDLTFGCGDIGPNVVTLTVTDINGQVNTCMSTITVEDNTAPDLVCKTTHTEYLDASGNAEATFVELVLTNTDNCAVPPTLSFTNGQTVYTCSDIGQPFNVEITADDGNGNTTPCTISVTVEDDTDPNFTCKSTHTEFLDADGSAEATFTELVLTNTDNCAVPPTLSFTNGQTVYTCSDIGQSFNVEITADDGNGNTTPCTVSVTVEDDTDPNFTCKSTHTEFLDTSGNAEVTFVELVLTNADNCSGTASLSFTGGQTSYTCVDESQTFDVEITADDGNGNTTPCTVNVEVKDKIAPVPTCKTSTVFLDASGNHTLLESDVFDGGTDNCGTVSFAGMDITSVDCNDVWSGPISVIVTADDGNGNEATCEASIYVEDNIDPVPTCKTSTVQLDASGNYNLIQSDVFDGGTDNCTTVNFLSMSPASVDCDDEGNIVAVLVTVFDASGNQATCTANVSVDDNTDPEPTCLDPTVQLDASGNYSLIENDVFGSGNDNCGTVNFVSMAPALVDCSNVGTPVAVTITANDGNGNEATCTSTVTVEDNVLPTALCQNATVQLDVTGNGSITVNDVDDGSSDNCGIDTRVLDESNFNCNDIGPNSVTMTVTDINGNSNSCVVTVTVEDNILPTANCITSTIQASLDTNGEYTVDPNEINDGSSDICGGITLSASPSLLDCQNEGPNTITLTVTDENGNSAFCTSTIEINDFITINSVTTVNESCLGAGDGSISIDATAGGGQIGYSTDNGLNFQFGGNFINLTPGSYSIVVKVFGIPAVCEKTATATINAGGTAQVWHKDADGDGYSDGNTQTSCSQPTGYIANPLAGNDCNDADPAINPGATETCDGLDNDCDGIIPADETDADGDGYMVCDGDCDDGYASVNPGATEICNGIDDDCDGEVDEGVGSGLTWTGNVTFTTQAEVDAWLACYSIIDGNLTIMGSGITDLSNLIGIEEVTGTVSIYYNSALTSLNGLDNLATVGGSLTIFYNFLLSDCCAIHGLINGGVTGSISIFFNASGCNSISDINSNCSNNLINNPYENNVITGDAFSKGKHLQVFPNPTSGGITVLFERTAPVASFQISDIFGRIIYRQELENGERRLQIDVRNNNIANGMYIVSLLENGKRTNKQLVVQHQ